jgi:hypothetical protein
MNHYHIQWRDSKLDWQAFQTQEEAEREAERLKRPGEKYSVVQQDGGCPRCSDIRQKAAR